MYRSKVIGPDWRIISTRSDLRGVSLKGDEKRLKDKGSRLKRKEIESA